MKILYHHRTLGDGAEGIHIREMIGAFRDLGHVVQVVALVGEIERTNAAQNAAQSDSSSQAERRWSKISEWLPGAAYECAEIGYNFVGRFMIDKAIRSFQPDLIYDRYNSFSTVSVKAGKRFHLPVFLEVNAPLAYERSTFERRSLRMPGIAKRYERYICGAADHVFAVSTPLKQFLVAEHEIDESRITILPNGVNLDAFDLHADGNRVRTRWGLIGKRVIGFVGILRPWHGIDMLLQVFQSIAKQRCDVHLLIVGDGPMESELKRMATLLSLSDRVTFVGRVPHGQINEHVAAMDIAVSPRATFYASPMKILEYMAMGVAVVAPDTANIRDVLTDGENSRLFAEDDANSFRSAIVSLLDNPQLSKQLGNHARRNIEFHRTWRHVAQRVLEKFDTVGGL